MLAAGWREIHHVFAGVHAESGNREAERGHVPHADLRRADDRHALADAEAWRGTLPARAAEKSRRENCGERGDWFRPGNDTGRDSADSARPGRNDVQRIFEEGAG